MAHCSTKPPALRATRLEGTTTRLDVYLREQWLASQGVPGFHSEPNDTHASFWHRAMAAGLVDVAEYDVARIAIGDMWSYTGD